MQPISTTAFPDVRSLRETAICAFGNGSAKKPQRCSRVMNNSPVLSNPDSGLSPSGWPDLVGSSRASLARVVRPCALRQLSTRASSERGWRTSKSIEDGPRREHQARVSDRRRDAGCGGTLTWKLAACCCRVLKAALQVSSQR